MRQTDQTVLLPVVQPVARPSRAYDSLKLVGFHPDDLIDSLVSERGNKVKPRERRSPWARWEQEQIWKDLPPKTEALSAQLHRPVRVKGRYNIEQKNCDHIKIIPAAKVNDDHISSHLKLNLPASNPKEDESIILQNGDVEFSHLIISQCSIGQLHVDVPGWVSHHNGKLPQDGHVQVSDITADPLQNKKKTSNTIHVTTDSAPSHLTCEGNSFPTLLSLSPARSPSSADPDCGPSRLPSASGGLSIS